VFNSPCRYYRFIIFGFLVLLSCNIHRDNILDPKNPNSYCPKKVMVEAFVNTENSFPYNEYMLSALDSLSKLYPDMLRIVEYHRNTSHDTSSYHLTENELLYQHYLNGFGSSLEGVPDVFINGIGLRVQGASSMQAVLFRLQQAILTVISANSLFMLEMTYEKSDDKITPKVTLARLGSDDAKDVLIKAVLTARIDEANHKRVVQGSVKSSEIPTLEHGEVKIYSLSEFILDMSLVYDLAVYITDKQEYHIYQCCGLTVE